MNLSKNLLTEKEVASILGVSVKTLQYWRFVGKPPSFIKLTRHIRYHPSEIERFIEERTINQGGCHA